MRARERRLDGEAYLTDGFQYRYRISTLKHSQPVKDLAHVWKPSRFKGVTVRPSAGVPFLAATQAFDVRPVTRKWLSPDHTPVEACRVQPGTILVTCSGNVGDSIMTYTAHAGVVVSGDLIRLKAHSAALAGYLYAYFRTRHGRTVMQSHQYGSVIKHLNPEHLETVPVPRFDAALEAELHATMRAAFAWRDEAIDLERHAEATYARGLGIEVSGSLDDPVSIPAPNLFTGRRRLDGYHYNAVAHGILDALGDPDQLLTASEEIVLPTAVHATLRGRRHPVHRERGHLQS